MSATHVCHISCETAMLTNRTTLPYLTVRIEDQRFRVISMVFSLADGSTKATVVNCWRDLSSEVSNDSVNYTVSKKTVQNCFCQNFVKFPPILIIFGRKIAKRLKLCEVHSFSTSTNSRCHTTMLNANVPYCYTTL